VKQNVICFRCGCFGFADLRQLSGLHYDLIAEKTGLTAKKVRRKH
jgi:hypothetical protein